MTRPADHLAIDPERVRCLNGAPVAGDGDFVLYWMTAARRTGWNFALQRAAWWALRLDRPLLVLEALRCDYPHASDRLHRFLLEGMADNARRLATRPAAYYPYLERTPGAGRGLLAALGEKACLVVGDDHPGFFFPRMLAAAAEKLPVSLEAVDGNGLLPVRTAGKAYGAAVHFRRLLQKELPGHLARLPLADPLKGLELPPPILPKSLGKRWQAATEKDLGDPALPAGLPLDHTIPPAPLTGGTLAARQRLTRFVAHHLGGYAEQARQPDADATSGLSPYLHFGHLAPHEIFARVAEAEDWSLGDLAPKPSGKRSGWWGMSDGAEAFLDQLVTWRELGFNTAVFVPGYDRYETLPDWARATLASHAGDPRPHLYTQEEFAAAATHDPLWNAAQTQLREEGRLHGYMRMLWGKKILEWSRSPRQALAVMTELNDRYALDGRDPNSVSGIFWCLGRYDHPWPERPVFGSVRSMSSQNTARKLAVEKYLARHGAEA